jgi:hypothetical protein
MDAEEAIARRRLEGAEAFGRRALYFGRTAETHVEYFPLRNSFGEFR